MKSFFVRMLLSLLVGGLYYESIWKQEGGKKKRRSSVYKVRSHEVACDLWWILAYKYIFKYEMHA